MLLRPVTGLALLPVLAGVIVLVVVAFLVHAAEAHRHLAVAGFRMLRPMHGALRTGARLPHLALLGKVVLTLEIAQELLVRLVALAGDLGMAHACSPGCSL